MSEPSTSPPDEYAAFRRLAEKLAAVPKREVDEKRAAERVQREQQQAPGKRSP